MTSGQAALHKGGLEAADRSPIRHRMEQEGREVWCLYDNCNNLPGKKKTEVTKLVLNKSDNACVFSFHGIWIYVYIIYIT